MLVNLHYHMFSVNTRIYAVGCDNEVGCDTDKCVNEPCCDNVDAISHGLWWQCYLTYIVISILYHIYCPLCDKLHHVKCRLLCLVNVIVHHIAYEKRKRFFVRFVEYNYLCWLYSHAWRRCSHSGRAWPVGRRNNSLLFLSELSSNEPTLVFISVFFHPQVL